MDKHLRAVLGDSGLKLHKVVSCMVLRHIALMCDGTAVSVLHAHVSPFLLEISFPLRIPTYVYAYVYTCIRSCRLTWS